MASRCSHSVSLPFADLRFVDLLICRFARSSHAPILSPLPCLQGHRPGGRAGHATAARDEVYAQGDAAGRPQAGGAIRGRGAPGRGHPAGAARHRPAQTGDRGSLRRRPGAGRGDPARRQRAAAGRSGLHQRRHALLLHPPGGAARAGGCRALRRGVCRERAVRRLAGRFDHHRRTGRRDAARAGRRPRRQRRVRYDPGGGCARG